MTDQDKPASPTEEQKLPPMQQQPGVEMENDEGADPIGDIVKQNPGETTTGDIASTDEAEAHPS
jgi:hypothetical protein